MEKCAIKAERQRDATLDKVTQQRQKSYELETALEEEKGKNLKLRAQINRDYENSSIPSSKTIRHKKMSNGREKNGRKPGAQPGHPGHGRKKSRFPPRNRFCYRRPGKRWKIRISKRPQRYVLQF